MTVRTSWCGSRRWWPPTRRRPPLVNLPVADDLGVTADGVRGVLIALGPVVGSARVLPEAGGL